MKPPDFSRTSHETIQREIEKERIREEIILAELASCARRCVLEAEVRRELMIERELAMWRGSNGFQFSSSPVMVFDSEFRLPLMGTRVEINPLDEIIPLPEERGRLRVSHENEGSESLPFQRGASDLRISEVQQPVLDGCNEKEKTSFLAKPDANLSGSKRKAVTPPGVDAGYLSLDSILKKKVKDEWSCALCQVSATSEQGLKAHLLGKKHKSNESFAFMKAQKARKKYSIGLFPKSNNPSQLKENLEVAQKAQNNGGSKKGKFQFWCEMCQVGASTEIVMNDHKRGKKHVRRLGVSRQNVKAGICNEEKIANIVNRAEEEIVECGKSINPEIAVFQ